MSHRIIATSATQCAVARAAVSSSSAAALRQAPSSLVGASNNYDHHNHPTIISSSTPTSPQIVRRGYHHQINNSNSSNNSSLFHPSSRFQAIDNTSDIQILCGTSRVNNGGVTSLYNIRPFTHRTISSTSTLLDDKSAEPKPLEDSNNTAESETAEDDDPCPAWQNPLHHNNPDYDGTKVLSEDFEEGEEMPVVPLPPFETDETEGKVLASPELHALADEIVHMNMIEVAELVDRIGTHFGFDDDDYQGDGGGGDGGAAEEEEVVEEKTVFDLKLTGFDAKSKIKVIKEIRGVTSLGLKEAKELVEGAPTTVKKDIKKEEAEELKAKLEAVGATVDIV